MLQAPNPATRPMLTHPPMTRYSAAPPALPVPVWPPAQEAPPVAPAPARLAARSWEARYGQVILQDGVAAIPSALYYYQGQLDLSAQEVWFVSAILACKWTSDLPHPSLKKLAAQAGAGEQWLRELRARLEQRGYVRVLAQHDLRGGQQANCYDFAALFARIEALILADPPAPNAIQQVAPPAADADPPGPDRDSSFLARYGRVLVRAGIATVPQALFTHQATLGLTPQQIWFIAYILSYRWSTDVPYPSLSKMAARTGYSRRQLQNIKDSLVAQGYLRLVPRVSAAGGTDSNGYDFGALFARLIALLQPGPPADPPPAPPVPPAPPRAPRRGRRVQAGSVETPPADLAPFVPPGGAHTAQEGGATPLHSGGHADTAQGAASLPAPPCLPITISVPARHAGPADGMTTLHRGRGGAAQGASAADAQGGRVAASHKAEPRQAEPQQAKADSNRPTRAKTADDNGDPLPYSPYIAGVILDHSAELGDTAHGPANVTQALRLWRQSALADDAFVALLHETRRRVRLYQGRQGPGTIANRMGYYFRVLTDLAGLAPAEAG